MANEGKESSSASHLGPVESHLNVRYLEAVWAVFRTGSQSEAARLLGLSQPAISKIVSYTETRIGVPLFHRVRGRLHPTPEGNVFFRAIDDIFSRLEGAERLARDLKSRVGGHIILATIPSLTQEFIPQAIGGFMQSHPLLKLSLKVLPGNEVTERVATGQADIGLEFGPVPSGTVETHHLCKMPVICALPRGHRLEKRDRITPDELANEPLISAFEGPRWGPILKAAFLQAGVDTSPTIECTQSRLALSLAEVGAGVAVVPLIPEAKHSADGVSISLLSPAIDIELLALTNRSQPMSKAAALLVDHLKRTVNQFDRAHTGS